MSERGRFVMVVSSHPSDWGLLRPIVADIRAAEIPVMILAMHEQPQLDFPEIPIALAVDESEKPAKRLHGAQLCYSTNKLLWEFLTTGNVHLDGIPPYAYVTDAVVLGDRAEVVGVAQVFKQVGVRVHHLYAGDESGTTDNVYRRAISMLADVGYTVTDAGVNHLMRINNARPDNSKIEIVRCNPVGLELDDNFLPDHDYAVAVLHPNHGSDEKTDEYVSRIVNKAIKDNVVLYVFLANGDSAVGHVINDQWMQYAGKLQRVKITPTMTRAQYLGLLSKAKWAAGNSSSLVLEAPHVMEEQAKIYLIGSRQKGRHVPRYRDDVPEINAVLLQKLRS